jgi:kinesin family protein 11
VHPLPLQALTPFLSVVRMTRTHTIEGDLSTTITENSGVIPRAIHTIFDQLAAGKYEDSNVKVSFLELYNEELADLLAEPEDRPSSSTMGAPSKNAPGDSDDKKELRIYEDVSGKKGMMVQGLEEVIVTNATDVFKLLQKANKHRKVAETNLNARSSRSHYVFTITVSAKSFSEDGEDIIKTGKLYLVDLAGSECIGKSGATDKRAKEAGKINASLLTLGRVINALVDRASFVPYRDSKLTRLLQESLGGRAKTVIIATVSPSYAAFDETISTLDYAHRAKSIKNKPQANQTQTKSVPHEYGRFSAQRLTYLLTLALLLSLLLPRRAYVKELLLEISSLKRDNEVLRSKNGIIVAPEKVSGRGGSGHRRESARGLGADDSCPLLPCLVRQWERMQMEATGKGMQIDELLFKIKTQETSMEALQAKLSEKEALLLQALTEKAEVTATLQSTVELLDSTRLTLAETKANLVSSQNLLIQLQRALYAREIELGNTKAIVSAQAQTESTLTSQALDTITKLEATLEKKNALHEKIARKTEVETHNQSVTGVYQGQTTAAIAALSKEETSFQDRITSSLADSKSVLSSSSEKAEFRMQEAEKLRSEFSEKATKQTDVMQSTRQAFLSSHLSSTHSSATVASAFHAHADTSFQAISHASARAAKERAGQVKELGASISSALSGASSDLQSGRSHALSFSTQTLLPAVEGVRGTGEKHAREAENKAEQSIRSLEEFKAEQSALVSADAAKLREKIAAMQQAMLAKTQSMQQSTMQSILQLQSASLHAFQSMQSAFETQFQSMQTEYHTSYVTMQSAYQTQVDQMQAEAWTSMQEMQEGFKREVEGMIETQQTQQISSVSTNVATVTSQLTAACAEEKQSQLATSAALNEITKNTEGFVAGVNEWATGAMNRNATAASDISSTLTSIQSDLSTSEVAIHEKIEKVLEENTQRAEVAQEESKQSITMVQEFSTSLSQEIALSSSISSTHCTALSAWLSASSAAQSAEAQKIAQGISTLEAIHAEHAPVFSGLVETLSNGLEAFVSKDLRADLPLGTTPVKAPLSYTLTSQLASTRSPAHIISSYRSANPAQPLQWQGVLRMDGVEDVQEDEIVAPVVQVEAIDLIIPETTVAAPAAAVSPVAAVSAKITPIAIDIEAEQDAENRPSSSGNAAPSPTNSDGEGAPVKPATKRVGSSRLAAPSKIGAAATVAPGAKPATRGKFGFAEAK